ncbi:hypothetical protein EIP91_002660 [Steccherinum ochraceum]|uniref:Uncharacterized protein n=1 Tax=Steccherinum ochraceum TaxID=92696 RepID=A0A4V2MW99_9APHY|nr:hypothetical protein EIP91_002660 [Steccherinum ochraceum]
MSVRESVFDTDAVKAIIAASKPQDKRATFKKKWDNDVNNLVTKWTTKRQNSGQAVNKAQLTLVANIVVYVDILVAETSIHGNSKTTATRRALPYTFPILGPRFVPPDYLHVIKHSPQPQIEVETAYLQTVTIVHPWYFETTLDSCRACGTDNTSWDGGWTTSGPRDVYGLERDEVAMGYQRRCETCKQKQGGNFCHATTNPTFWEGWSYWEIPQEIPFFLKRCAVTRSLYNLIAEIRVKSTSGAVAEHIKQLHLYTYMQAHLAYLRAFKEHRRIESSMPREFSQPNDPAGYNDSSITNDIVTEVYYHFGQSRCQESAQYCRTRTGRALGTDATLKVAKKAAVVNAGGDRLLPFASSSGGGGAVTVINEFNEYLGFWFLLTQQNAELTRIFEGIATRFDILGVNAPEAVISDNCCHIERALKAVFPDILSLLDVYHFSARYGPAISGGTKNPLYKTVLREITGAILKTRAGEEKGKPATYWSQPEQEKRLVAVFEKYLKQGGVWSESAVKIHNQQLHHVKKGCLSRPLSLEEDSADGSRIEGGHKGMKGLNFMQACGLLMMTILMFDFIHRRNISVARKKKIGGAFAASTLGSHHTGLVNHVATLWNELITVTTATTDLTAEPSTASSLAKKGGLGAFFTPVHRATNKAKVLTRRPQLQDVASGEFFGPFHSPTTLPDVESLNLAEYSDIHIKDDEDDENTIPEDEDASAFDNTTITELPSTSSLSTQSICKDGQKLDHHESKSKVAATITSEQVIDLTRDATEETACCPVSTYKPSAVALGKRKADVACVNDEPDVDGVDCSAVVGASSSTVSAVTAPQEPERKRICVPGTRVAWNSTVPIDYSFTKLFNAQRQATVKASKITASADADFSESSETILVSTSQASVIAASGHAGTTGVAVRARKQDIYAVLPLPSDWAPTGRLSRTQLLFRAGTGLDPRALQIGVVDRQEYVLFMKMRTEQQWSSFSMTSRSWSAVGVIGSYNRRLKALSMLHGFEFVPKSSRALSRKLGEIESTIMLKVASGNYKSATTGDEEFWRTASEAVPAVHAIASALKSKDGKVRKNQACTRCQTIMYPGGVRSSENHKPGYCSDGAPVHFKRENYQDFHHTLQGAVSDHPPYPQPAGIFDKGKSFDPIAFLTTLRDVYECYIVEKGTGGEKASEYEAFAEMLLDRTTTTAIEGGTYFKLFRSLTVTDRGLKAGIIVDHTDGCKYLRLDSMQDTSQLGQE